jgi:hypothetical protein
MPRRRTARAATGCRAFFSSNEKIKSFIITAGGALALKQRLQQLTIPHNNTFSGIYNFAQAANYSNFFKKFLKFKHFTKTVVPILSITNYNYLTSNFIFN